MQTLSDFFSSGSDFDSDKLVRLRALAKLLPVAKQRKIFNDLSGDHHSSLRGRGMDYAEVRQYQSGDDIRSMDWRVTARTGKAHIKVYHEERERPVLIVTDLRAGMFFGSKRCLKAVLAADLTALLAWACIANGDRLGALLFAEQQEFTLRPHTGSATALALIHQLCQFTPSHNALTAPERLPQICRHLRRIVRPGSRVYILSDWAGFNDDARQELYQVSCHSDVMALQLYDPLEAELPPPGYYSLTDGLNRSWLTSHTTTQRQAYADAFAQRRLELQQALQSLRIPLASISTADSMPLDALRQGLGLSPRGQR